ncbi:chaperone protein dnaJ 1, mitochondrial isoform X1 [Primulina huaijiensis]|uniref:chaperone protein dnaJ 1, mitochondrial isoform X1 n=1 Tax=Primulina huaijiensis TaxID=1492673 RepID=UPI003CC72A9D
MGFSSSSKSLLQNFLFRWKLSVESSRVLVGNVSQFQRGLIHSAGDRNWSGSAGKPADYATFRLPSLKRFIHATGACQSVERDHYAILGISEDANPDEIKKAFHVLAKKYHPDASKNTPSAKRKFQEIRDAYETLQDPEKKAQYDGMRKSSRSKKNAEYTNWDGSHFKYDHSTRFSDSFQKIFAEIFENETENLAADIEVELLLTFPEAAEGCTKHLSFDADVPCDSCDGQGHPLNAEPRRCPTCQGSGRITIPPFATTCSTCKGFGRIIKECCLLCKGSGVCEGVKDVKVTIPAGVDSGDTVHVPKAGNAGRWGRSPSNLFIKLKVADDPIFSRQGADIYVNNHINFTQAILGGKVEVPTLSGNLQLRIPKGVQHGHLVVLRGKGLPRSGFLIDHGDQYVRFCINFPLTVSERQRAILEEFEEIRDGNDTSAEGRWWQWWLQHDTRPKLLLEFSILILILLFLGKVLI